MMPSTRPPRRRPAQAVPLVAAALLAAGAGIVPPATPVPHVTQPLDLVGDGLQALHRGDYSRAHEDFKEAAVATPGDPGLLFFFVFSRWWQMIFAGGVPVRGDANWVAFEGAYDDVVAAATARLDTAPDDPRALAALGAVQVLRAHVEALLGSYFRAGSEARHGKKSLRRALDLAPDLDGALFPLGALNYYADRVPLVVKTIRPLLFLPGGDASLGLAQIRRVALGNGVLHTDGRLLMGLLCADRYQRAYREALAHLDIARRATGGSPLIGAAIGDLQERLAETDEAVATFAGAVEEAAGAGPERARQRRWLRLGQAEALVAGWRLDEADAALRAARAEPAADSTALQRMEGRIREELGAKRAGAPFDTSGPAAEVLEAAAAAIRADPAAPIPRLVHGRLLYLAGRDQEALVDLAVAAAGAGNGPAWLTGWSELYAGFAETRLGRVGEAREHFRDAAAVRRFRSSERALLELGDRGREADLCAP